MTAHNWQRQRHTGWQFDRICQPIHDFHGVQRHFHVHKRAEVLRHLGGGLQTLQALNGDHRIVLHKQGELPWDQTTVVHQLGIRAQFRQEQLEEGKLQHNENTHGMITRRGDRTSTCAGCNGPAHALFSSSRNTEPFGASSHMVGSHNTSGDSTGTDHISCRGRINKTKTKIFHSRRAQHNDNDEHLCFVKIHQRWCGATKLRTRTSHAKQRRKPSQGLHTAMRS